MAALSRGRTLVGAAPRCSAPSPFPPNEAPFGGSGLVFFFLLA